MNTLTVRLGNKIAKHMNSNPKRASFYAAALLGCRKSGLAGELPAKLDKWLKDWASARLVQEDWAEHTPGTSRGYCMSEAAMEAAKTFAGTLDVVSTIKFAAAWSE